MLTEPDTLSPDPVCVCVCDHNLPDNQKLSPSLHDSSVNENLLFLSYRKTWNKRRSSLEAASVLGGV